MLINFTHFKHIKLICFASADIRRVFIIFIIDKVWQLGIYKYTKQGKRKKLIEKSIASCKKKKFHWQSQLVLIFKAWQNHVHEHYVYRYQSGLCNLDYGLARFIILKTRMT